jgi:transposase
MSTADSFRLKRGDRSKLEKWLKMPTLAQGEATRARIVLALNDGTGAAQIAAAQRVAPKTVYRWMHRYEEMGLDGLRDLPRSGRPSVIDDKIVRRVLKLTTQKVPQEATHWSIRLMAQYAQVSCWQVRQIWEAADLKPHRIKTFKISNDPHFADKVVDIVGLYMDPPNNALVLCVDEKSQIQALDRTQPGLPLSPGRVASRTHDYKRHGTACLFAAFNVLNGQVIGKMGQSCKSHEFLGFMKMVEKKTPKEKDLHIVLDNLSAHKTPEVSDWLKRHPRVHFHFTPTSSSWLNAVEGWFSQLERRSLYRGVFTSVGELINEIERFIEVHNDYLAKPFVWTADPAKILAAVGRARKALQN